MWHVDKLVAFDAAGNSVTIDDEKITVTVTKDKIKIIRRFDFKETLPCLSIAVDDLIKQLNKT